ncbi:MAG: alpha/beta fold hydrolase [Firmicutes bacterium]|nr:alpha/beta fold hydrolase [Bacillota bacterium]
MERPLRTKYPLVLIHGAGFRDLKWPVYWGRIPAVLEKEGAEIFYGLQDCWASVETNAEAITRRIDEILQETGSEKVNIIAHSKGGLDARMAASSFGCGDKIASITTIATPHHGSGTIDKLFAIPRSVWNVAAFAVNNWIRVVGDKKPDFLKLCEDFTTERMAAFNENNPDVPGIYYQSFACAMKHPFSDINLSTANAIINRLEGENDGLVTVESARWGQKHTILRSNTFRGISHLDAIDLRRSCFTRKNGSGVSDICDVYIGIVQDLKERGL